MRFYLTPKQTGIIILHLILILLVGLGTYFFYVRATESADRVLEADAYVHSVRVKRTEDSDEYYATITYEDTDHRQFRKENLRVDDSWQSGQTRTVFYEPQNPMNVRTNRDESVLVRLIGTFIAVSLAIKMLMDVRKG
jgi:CHASE1-domain containing sensor protein